MSRIDVPKTLQAIADHFKRQQSHTDSDRLHVTKEELRLAKGRISKDADAVIDTILTNDKYTPLAESVSEAWLQGRHLGPFPLSLADLHRPSSSACRTLQSQSRDRPQPLQSATSSRTTNRHLAQSMVRVVGTATREDADLVAAELVKMPREILFLLKNSGHRVSVCRNNVTEYRTDLRGVEPRGWPPGMTFADVPMMSDATKNETTIATIDRGGNRVLDHRASRNGVLHEALHAYDSATDAADAPEFLEARRADWANLRAYHRQTGAAGREETFAENLCRFLDGDKSLARELPHLNAYFRKEFWPRGQSDE